MIWYEPEGKIQKQFEFVKGGIVSVFRKGFLMSLALLLATSLIPSAALANDDSVSLGEINGVPLRTATSLERAVSEMVALHSPELQEAKKALPKGLEANWSERFTLVIGTDTWVFVPLKGGEKGSHIGLKVKGREVVGSQVVYSKVDGDTTTAGFVRDGVTLFHMVVKGNKITSGFWLKGDKTVDLAGMTMSNLSTMASGGVSTTASSGVSTMASGGFWSCLNDCLASQGVNQAIIAILGVLCAAACATLVLCSECIAAYAGATSGTIGYCVYVCW